MGSRKIKGAVRVRVFADQTQRIADYHMDRANSLGPESLKKYKYSNCVREVIDAGLEALGYPK